MTNSEIKEIALRQSAEDIGCRPEDFLSDNNVVVPFCLGEKARKYYQEPITCSFVSYGSNVVAATTEEVSAYLLSFGSFLCFSFLPPPYRLTGYLLFMLRFFE